MNLEKTNRLKESSNQGLQASYVLRTVKAMGNNDSKLAGNAGNKNIGFSSQDEKRIRRYGQNLLQDQR